MNTQCLRFVRQFPPQGMILQMTFYSDVTTSPGPACNMPGPLTAITLGTNTIPTPKGKRQ